jgi:DNA (cytosine-5)-methyltransferase 1
MGFEREDRPWHIPVSDTQAYRQFGNAVVVPVVEFLAQAMKPHIQNAVANSRDRADVSQVDQPPRELETC